jgi:hypothetical protein
VQSISSKLRKRAKREVTTSVNVTAVVLAAMKPGASTVDRLHEALVHDIVQDLTIPGAPRGGSARTE